MNGDPNVPVDPAVATTVSCDSSTTISYPGTVFKHYHIYDG